MKISDEQMNVTQKGDRQETAVALLKYPVRGGRWMSFNCIRLDVTQALTPLTKQ